MHSADDLVMSLNDFNGHMGRHVDGFDGVHGGHSVCQRNLKDECYSNFTWRRNCVKDMALGRRKRKVTFRQGGNRN